MAMRQRVRGLGKYRLSRRRLMAGAAAGFGVGVAGLAGCGGAGKGGSAPAASRAQPTSGPIDSTKGRPGGTFRFQVASYPGSLLLTQRRDTSAGKFGGLCHSGLLAYRNGRPGVPGTDVSVEPDLAQAIPEQPDQLTYVYKLKPARFHNGRAVTAEDAQYSYEQYASGEKSAWKQNWTWLDTVQTPDPQTVVVKTRMPFADALQSMAIYDQAFILAKEFEESPEAAKSMMGSGPYIWAGTQAPVSTSFRKNPDYFAKPYPYFDQLEAYTSTDDAKRVADFSARNLDLTWWNNEELRDEIKQARPDARVWAWRGAGFGIFMRTDKPPFNDKRVRQALSMAINRKAVRDGVSKGEGEDDQVLSIIDQAWGFRKPSELGAAAKYWKYDPQAAKQLLNAAGIDKPIETTWTHWDAAVTGQSTVDMATLIEANWKELGIANVKDVTVTGAQFVGSVALGNYEGMGHGPNKQDIVLATNFYESFYAPPGGVHPPTSNNGYVDDPQLNALLQKQMGQFNFDERRQTFRAIEDLMAEQQYRIILSTYTQTWFSDPSVKDIQVPIFAYAGSGDYFKYWWFEK